MNYLIRTYHNGVIYEAFSRDYASAIVVFEALENTGYHVELWQGSTKLR